MGFSAMDEKLQRVVVGICTCRRPIMLRACLDSLAAQTLPPDVAMQIVVVDNEEQPNNQAGVEAFAAACPFPVHYVHQPRRGIATARNAILDTAMALGADQIAMIDDDETADPQWVANLMAEEYRHIPVLAGFKIFVPLENPRPFWSTESARKRKPQEGLPRNSISTSNVRFSSDLVRAGVRFDESLGLANGENHPFFAHARQLGFPTHATCRAITYECSHRERATYRYRVSRNFAKHAVAARYRQQNHGRLAVVSSLPPFIGRGTLGVFELAVSPLALLLGSRRFKKLAIRGGCRVASLAGILAGMAGHLPQPYRNVVGN